jgi:hypothetical protein
MVTILSTLIPLAPEVRKTDDVCRSATVASELSPA